MRIEANGKQRRRAREPWANCVLVWGTDRRIAFATDAHEVALVGPLFLQELERVHHPGAQRDEVDPARDLVTPLGYCVGILGRPIGRAAPHDAVRFTSVSCASRISRGFIRRMCERNGTRYPCASFSMVGSASSIIRSGPCADAPVAHDRKGDDSRGR